MKVLLFNLCLGGNGEKPLGLRARPLIPDKVKKENNENLKRS